MKRALSVLLLTEKHDFGKKEGLPRFSARQSFFNHLSNHCKPL
jgi:hypothetical protein